MPIRRPSRSFATNPSASRILPCSADDGAPLAVRVRGLVKSYARSPAVDGIDLDIRSGEVFALLGPNGAGKTTTVEILEGYRTRDSGEVTVLGYDPSHERAPLKSRIGIVLQSTGIEPYLSVLESVTMYAELYPHSRPVNEVIELVGLTDKRKQRVKQLSGGLQRRLDVAIALVGDPELLFLDEPTTGFDPSARRDAWSIVKDLASLGKTVVLTTHYMDEAEYLADRVAVMSAGRIVAEGTPATIGARNLAKATVRFRLRTDIQPPVEFRGIPGVDGFTEITVNDSVLDVYRLLQWAISERADLEGFEVKKPSLEDVYLSLTSSETLADSEQTSTSKGESS